MARLTYPDGIDDHPGILQYRDDIEEACQAYRDEIERSGVGNILYYLGKHWLTFDTQLGLYTPQFLPKGTPRPVVNQIAPLVNSVRSMLVNYKVPITYTPGSDQPADVSAALVADRVHAVIEKETDLHRWVSEAAGWVTLTGNTFLLNGYDISHEYGTTPIQQDQCVGNPTAPGCGAVLSPSDVQQNGGKCPQCGNPGVLPATQDGQPVIKDYPRGQHATEVKSALSVYVDNLASSVQKSPYFMVVDRVSRSWIVETYGEEALEGASPDQATKTSLIDALTYATGAYGLGQPSSDEADEVYRLCRLWIRPHPVKAPQGIYANIVGDKVMESLPWPYRSDRGTPMLPVVHIPFDQVPGRLLGKSRVDDLIPLQDQLNRLEAYLDLHTKRMAGGKLLLPRGMGIGRVTGETGQVLTYDWIQGAPGPQFVPGTPVPQYLQLWKQDILARMDAIMGTFEVGRGEAPRGVTAYSAIQYLDERGQEAQSNIQQNWAVGRLEWARQHMAIWRDFADEPRTMSLGFGAWSVRKFSKADMAGAVDMDAEIGQSRPRTNVAKRAVVDQAVRLGAVNIMDPQQQYQVLKALGATDLMPDYKVDQDRAARENDAFLQPPDPMKPPFGYPMPFPWDNHSVHLGMHRNLQLSEEGEQLPPENKAALVEHMKIHQGELIRRVESMGSKGPGQIAPAGPGNEGGKNEGAAKAGSQADTEDDLLEEERQGASPDTFTGAAAQ